MEPTTTASGDERAPDDAVTALIDGLVRAGDELPFNQHLGVRVVELEVGRATTVLPANPALSNHLGGVHAIAELAPVELAGALAASTRLSALLSRGFVPVVGSLTTTFRAPASGDLHAHATVGEDVIAPALAAADAGERPRLTVPVQVTDASGTVVTRAELEFVYLDLGATGSAEA